MRCPHLPGKDDQLPSLPLAAYFTEEQISAANSFFFQLCVQIGFGISRKNGTLPLLFNSIRMLAPEHQRPSISNTFIDIVALSIYLAVPQDTMSVTIFWCCCIPVDTGSLELGCPSPDRSLPFYQVEQRLSTFPHR